MIINFSSLLPITILAGSAVIMLLVIAFKRSHLLINLIGLLAILAASVSLLNLTTKPVDVYPLFVVDGFGMFLLSIIFFAALVVMVLSFGYLSSKEENKEEYYVFILLGTIGASILVISKHFISFFLGLELLSVSLYVLISYLRTWNSSIEAGVKYLILAGVSSAFLLFGMALIYAEVGSMQFNEIGNSISAQGIVTPMALTGIAFLIVGVGFKLAIVPFHMWTPDIYEGAPAPVTAFIATISKGGVFAVLIRLFNAVEVTQFDEIMVVFSIIAVLSMMGGNWLALLQRNVKRILAYSSISHLGYLLVAFLASGNLGIEAVSFYLLSYFITILGAFGIVSVISNQERDANHIEDYHGMFWRRPWVATIFTIMLLSLAGIPLTAGFIGKYFVLMAGVSSGLWLLVAILIISSVIGLYYYLRIIVEMFKKPDELVLKKSIKSFYTLNSGYVLIILSILLIWYGVYPDSIMNLIQNITQISF